MVEEKEKEEQEKKVADKKVAENQKEEEKKVANKSIPPDKDFPNYIIVKIPANPVSEDPSEEQSRQLKDFQRQFKDFQT